MNTNRMFKRLLSYALATTLISVSAFAISKEKLAELQAKAETGNGISQYNLGLIYADPQESIGNILEAYVWFSLAAENGAPGKALMIVSNQLTPDQLSEGKKLLEKRRVELATPKSPIVAAPAKSPVTASPVIVAPAEPDTSAIQAELAAAKTKLAAAEAALAKATAGLTKAEATAAELAATKQNLTGLNEQLQKLTAENQHLANQIKQTEKTAEEKAAASEKTLNEINGELLKTQARLAETSNQSSIQNSVAASANTELAAQRQANTELNAMLQKLSVEKDQAIAQATKTTTESQQQIDALTARLAASDEAIAKVTAEQAELKTQLSAARIDTAKGAKDAELEARSKEIAELQAKLKETEIALATAKEAPARPVVQAPESDSQSADLKKELNESLVKLDVTLRSYQLQQNEIERLQNALANIDNERAKLAERLETASMEASTASTKAAAGDLSAAQLAGVREQLRQTQNQLASIAYENTEMKRRIAFMGPSPQQQAGTITPLPISLPATSLNTPSRPGAAKPAAAEPIAAPATPRTHTVVTGDTLSTIAKRYYGSTSRWTEILEANKATLRDPASLRIGMKLKIP